MFYLLFDKLTIRSSDFIEKQKIFLRILSRKALFRDLYIFLRSSDLHDRQRKISEVKTLFYQERQQLNSHNGFNLISLSYISRDNNIIISEPEESLALFFNGKDIGENLFANKDILLDDKLLTRTVISLVNKNSSEVTGYLAAYSVSARTGIIPLSIVDFNIRYILWGLSCLAFFAFHIALLFILTWVIVKRMTNPLTRLARASKQIAEGELNIKVHIERNDEIGVVAARFNKMAERLRKNALFERRFGDLARTSTDWIWEIDKNYLFTYSNPAVKSLIGYNSEEILRKSPFYFTHPQDRDKLNQVLLQLSHNKKPLKSVRHRIIRKDSTVSYLDISAVAIYNGQGKIEGFRGIGRDVTQQYWAEQERERLNKELTETNREIEQFVYSVSHDLQRPLLSMKSMLMLFAQEPSYSHDKVTDTYLVRLQKCITSMSNMIESLVEVSKVGRVDMEGEYIDVEELVQGVVDEVKLRANTHNITFTIIQPLPGVWCNRKRLIQVFSNLIDNAVKFMSNHEEGKIVISGDTQESFIHYCVSDNGPGIDSEYHENIFNMFERLHGDSISGNGMGLYFIKKIIETYKGKIWVESQAAYGAAFHFTLPIYENILNSVK